MGLRANFTGKRLIKFKKLPLFITPIVEFRNSRLTVAPHLLGFYGVRYEIIDCTCNSFRVEWINTNSTLITLYNSFPKGKIRSNNRNSCRHVFEHFYRQSIQIINDWVESHQPSDRLA